MMPRYFFHSVDGIRDRNPDGIVLADDRAAQMMAVVFAGETLRDQPSKLWDDGQWRVEVTDERGLLRWTVINLTVEAPMPMLLAEESGEAHGG